MLAVYFFTMYNAALAALYMADLMILYKNEDALEGK